MVATAVTVGGTLVGGVVISNPPAPITTSEPSISGNAAYSGDLTVSSPAAFAGPYIATGQVWEANGTETGVTSNTYAKSASDAGKSLRLKMFANGPGGSVFAYSTAIDIAAPLGLSSGLFPEGQAGSEYSFTLAATGGVAPYTYAVSVLPGGLSVNASTGVVSGTPSVVGNTAYTVTVTDSLGATFAASSSFTISTTPVGAISDLSQTELTASSVTLSFTAATNATSYQYRLNSGTWTSLPVSKVVAGLTANTAYAIEVRGLNAYGTGSASNTLNVTTLSGAGTPTIGLGYTPVWTPIFTLRATRALLLTDLGLTSGDVITASDYAGFELALDAANTAQKPLVVGTDNGAYTFTATRNRVYQDVLIYGYGATMPKISSSGTGSSRLNGYLCAKANDIAVYGVEFAGFVAHHAYAGSTLPLARPEQSGYNAATTPAKREPYHTSNDKLTTMSHAAVENGFIMEAVGHFTVAGSPTFTSIKPDRFKSDGGAGGTRVPYNYKVSGVYIYDDTTAGGNSTFSAALDSSAPDLLATPVSSATAASLAAAINANTATSGFSAQVDPWTGKVVVKQRTDWHGTIQVATDGTLTVNSTAAGSLAVGMTVCCVSGSSTYAWVLKSGSGATWTVDAPPSSAITSRVAAACKTWARPLDWTISSTGGTVTKDAVGVAIKFVGCKVTGCDRSLGGIGDQTAVGRIDYHSSLLRQTWAAISLNYLSWTGFWSANVDYGECNLTDTAYTGSGRASGNAQTGATNQDGTLFWIGSNNTIYMRYQKQRGTKVHIENCKFWNVDGYTNTDTVTSAGLADFRLVWDNSANKRDDHTFNYNDVKNVRNLLGSIDSQLIYVKGDSFTVIYNLFDGFGAKRKSASRSVGTATSQGSECGGFLAKNNDLDLDVAGVIYIAFNYFTRGPNGLPWVKTEDKGGSVQLANNRFRGWIAQLDDGTFGDANGRALVLWTGSGSAQGNLLLVTETTSGSLSSGMRVVIGSTAMHIVSPQSYSLTANTTSVSARSATGNNGWAGTASLSSNVVTIISTTTGSVATGMVITFSNGVTATLASGPGWSLASSVSSVSGSATADLINTQDGVLIRLYNPLRNFKLVSNFFDCIGHQGQVIVLLHQITNSGGTWAEYEFSNNIAQNDNTADYPQHTGNLDWFYSNSTPSGMGSVSSTVVGRNETRNAAGMQVGAITWRQGSTYYTDNNNSVSKPYVAVP